jgi:hypothetical protein
VIRFFGMLGCRTTEYIRVASPPPPSRSLPFQVKSLVLRVARSRHKSNPVSVPGLLIDMVSSVSSNQLRILDILGSFDQI